MCECSSVQSGIADCSELSTAATAATAVVDQFWSPRGWREGPRHYSFFSIKVIILKKNRRGWVQPPSSLVLLLQAMEPVRVPGPLKPITKKPTIRWACRGVDW